MNKTKYLLKIFLHFSPFGKNLGKLKCFASEGKKLSFAEYTPLSKNKSHNILHLYPYIKYTKLKSLTDKLTCFIQKLLGF